MKSIALIFPGTRLQGKKSIYLRLEDFCNLTSGLVDEALVITSKDAVCPHKLRKVGSVSNLPNTSNLWLLAISELRVNIQVAYHILRLPKRVKWILHRGRLSSNLGGLIVSKLTGKKSAVFIEGIGSELIKDRFFSLIYRCVELVFFDLVDLIVSDYFGLFSHKEVYTRTDKLWIFPTPIRYVSERFEVIRPPLERINTIGFIGRLREEKGVIEFARAAIELPEMNFTISGVGPLGSHLKRMVKGFKHIEVTGWVEHNDLPKFLNNLKAVVIPSDYEGLSNVVMEAMACGTLVFATPVGGIPDLITHEETGFLLKDGSKSSIIDSLNYYLKRNDTHTVCANARRLIEYNHMYDSVRPKWVGLLKEMFYEEEPNNVRSI